MSKPEPIRESLIPPILLALLFFTIAFVFRFIDIFVLGLHLTPFSIITSKVIPLVLLLVYVGVVYRTFSILGIHTRYLIINIVLGVLIYLTYFVIPYFLEYSIELSLGLAPLLSVAFNPLLFVVYYFIFYVINSFMEEGVFRGLMMRCFMTKTNVYAANIIQALFFGLWHIVWPISAFLSGMDPISAGWYAAYYVLSTFGFGIVTGYMFQKTSSLIGPIILHTLWNYTLFMITWVNLVPITDSLYLLTLATTLLTEIVGLVIALIITKVISDRRQLPELTAWNQPLP